MTVSTKGLGRGLDSLIPNNFDSSLLLDQDERIQNVFISDISPNPDQPRKTFDKQQLEELAESIKRYGILQPLILVSNGNGKYKIVAGERRWRASKLAGLDKVPVLVRKEEELEQLEIALIENVQRVDLSPIDQAISIERLHQQFNMSYQAIAERLGKAAPTLNNLVRLLQLPPQARKALESKQITEGHARAILALKEQPEKQAQLLADIMNKGLSVRQAEQFVQAGRASSSSVSNARKNVINQTPETKKLAKQLGTEVTLQRLAKGGRLQIHYGSDKQLDDLVSRLGQD